MSKIITIGDTHGRQHWKFIVTKHDDADKVIFIGDYFDTHENTTGLEQLQNFYDICEYKKANLEKVVLLIGNHDFHYWPGIEERYSGYQPLLRPSFEFALSENKDLLQMCYEDENGIFYTHAGISETFLNNLKIGSEVSKIADELNEMWKHKPHLFAFNHLLDYSGYGDHPASSCIWIRPQALYSDKIASLQVVGHTTVTKINHPPKSERRGFYLIDALGTTGEYLVIKDGIIEIDKIQ